MKIKNWTKTSSKGIYIRYGGGWLYIYQKGYFRNSPNNYVVSTSLTGGSNPIDRQNTPFKKEVDAKNYAIDFMKTNP